MTHRIFTIKNGERINVGQAIHTVTRRILLKNNTGGTGALLWTRSDAGNYFLMATYTDKLEILGYKPAKKVVWGAEGFLCNGKSYKLPENGSGWFAEDEVNDIYITANSTGSRLLVIRCGTALTGFAERTRYNPAAVQ